MLRIATNIFKEYNQSAAVVKKSALQREHVFDLPAYFSLSRSSWPELDLSKLTLSS